MPPYGTLVPNTWHGRWRRWVVFVGWTHVSEGVRSRYEVRMWRWLLIVALTLFALVVSNDVPAFAVGQSGPGGGNTPNLTISSPNPPSGTAGATVILNGLSWSPQASISFVIGPAGARQE